MDPKRLEELEARAAALQKEIEDLKAQVAKAQVASAARQAEIPVGTIVKVWDDDLEPVRVTTYAGFSANRTEYPHNASNGVWCHAVPHPNYMMWMPHDGGPQPVAGGTRVVVILRDGRRAERTAKCFRWTHDENGGDIIAYAVLTTPEFVKGK